MKNKRFIYKSVAVLLLASIGLGAISCNDSNLEDVQNTGTFDTDNYFKNEEQAYSGLIATYDLLRKYSGGFENMVTFFNAASDDCYSGGEVLLMAQESKALLIIVLTQLLCLQAIGKTIIRGLQELIFYWKEFPTQI